MSLTVLQLLPELNSGGVERGTLEVANELAKKGHRSLVMSGGGRLVDQLQTAGSEHIKKSIGKKSPTSLLHIPALRHLMLSEKIDIVHARSRMPAWLSWLAWKSINPANRPKFITTFHGPYTPGYYSKIMVRGENIIAVSEFIASYILKHFPGTDPAKIKLIPRGISSSEFYPGFKPEDRWLQRWRRDFPELDKKVVLCLPGRITRRKGHEDFILIVKKLVEAGHQVHALIVGSISKNKTSYLDSLQQLIMKNDLNRHITFIDHRNDLREIMSVSNVVLSLSKLPESFGRTVLESLSLGVPVIAYNIGGVSEIMNRLYPDGLVDINNIDMVFNKIVGLINTPANIKTNNDFMLENMLNTELSLYQELVDPRD